MSTGWSDDPEDRPPVTTDAVYMLPSDFVAPIWGTAPLLAHCATCCCHSNQTTDR